MTTSCRLVTHPAARGAWNMALDEALLESVVKRHVTRPTLRWYRWKEPTLSLGYFQAWNDRPVHLSHLSCVRRITGGGAILHDDELTYSLVIPAGQWPRRHWRDVVVDVHCAMQAALEGLDVSLVDCKHCATASPADEPFLCFERRAAEDVVVGSAKVVGSAQRHRGGALLQHGSILMRKSSLTPRLAGLLDCGYDKGDRQLAESMADALGKMWGVTFQADDLAAAETEAAQILDRDKYSQPRWNQRR